MDGARSVDKLVDSRTYEKLAERKCLKFSHDNGDAHLTRICAVMLIYLSSKHPIYRFAPVRLFPGELNVT